MEMGIIARECDNRFIGINGYIGRSAGCPRKQRQVGMTRQAGYTDIFL